MVRKRQMAGLFRSYKQDFSIEISLLVNGARLVVARILEDAHQEGHSSVRISLKHDDYNVDLQTMQQARLSDLSRRICMLVIWTSA